MRIVSLLPSATEMVCALGLEDSLVGVSHECDHPGFVGELPKVTRALIPADADSAEVDRLVRERVRTNQALYALDLPTLERLRPDLIVTQALCDVCAVAEEEVQKAACRLPGNPRVINLEPQTLAGVFAAIRQVGKAAGVDRIADDVVGALTDRVDVVVSRSAQLDHRPRVAFLEWLDPPFSAGHWNPELVRLAGGVDVLGREGQRSRTMSWEEVAASRPEVMFIACCGYDIERTLVDVASLPTVVPGWYDLPAVRAGRVHVTDGSQYFNRPGPRLVDSLELLAHTLHPKTHPLASHLQPPIRVAELTVDVSG
jgi:iron complex transport system substrate-binding protein